MIGKSILTLEVDACSQYLNISYPKFWKFYVRVFWTIVIYSNFGEVDIIFYIIDHAYAPVNIVNRHNLRLAVPKLEIIVVEPFANTLGRSEDAQVWKANLKYQSYNNQWLLSK